MRQGVIEPCTNPSWISNIVPIQKENGKLRICLDMRRVNEAVIPESFPIPNVEEILSTIPRNACLSKIDLVSAYFHIELHPTSRYLTAFVTKKGIFQFTRLLMGVKSAPALFCQTLTILLGDLRGIIIYLDDILVYGATKEEHDENLRRLLDRLAKLRLVINGEKSVYGVHSLTFVGHVIDGDGIRPMESKVKAIKSFRRPKTLTELESFLGLVTYVGKFMPNLSDTLLPLRELVSMGSIQGWNNHHEDVLNDLKRELANERHLSFFDMHQPTILIVDASPTGLGAVLLQKVGNEYKPIAYASKTLSEVEQRYSQVEKEALAIVWGMEKFRYFLLGIKFELLTDCKALEFLFSPRSIPCARIERWVLRVQCFDYTAFERKTKHR